MSDAPTRFSLLSAPADDAARAVLRAHLAPAVDRGQLTEDTAAPDVVVVLVSRAWLAAAEPVPTGPAVVPVILEACDWRDVPGLDPANAFPRGSRSLADSPDPDRCWQRVATGVAMAGDTHRHGHVAPRGPKVESTATRVAFMLAALGLLLAGPLYAWLQ